MIFAKRFSYFILMKRNTLFVLSLLCIVFFVYSCSKELSLENSISTTVAEGSLWDTAGSCLPDSVYGTYYTGVQPGADTAYIEIQVDVAVAGAYNISTDLQNGFMFSDSGFFAATGINTIQLKPIGTPILIQPTVFTVSFDSTTCFLAVNVLDSTGLGLGGTDTIPIPGDSTNLSDTAWQFSVGAGYYHGQIDYAFVTDTLGLKFLTILGTDVPTGDTVFSTGIFFTDTVGTGTFTTDLQATVSLTTIDQSSNYITIYEANAGTASLGITTITITSYDAATGIITGSFSGTAKDVDGNAVTISNGSFKAKIT
jgi:hypothetical protein